MPSFSEIAQELFVKGANIHDLRLHYMRQLSDVTGRPLIVYAASSSSACPSVMVEDDDVAAFMETLRGISLPRLDLILHSNGGSPDAADMIVAYLREKFDDVRVIVPRQVMSAATMIACGADEIVLARHSFMGPIDLQFSRPGGAPISTQEVLDQYELIRSEFDDANAFWKGAGMQYFPTLLVQCKNALADGKEVVERYLRDVMFRAEAEVEAARKAHAIASDLADHVKHKQHGRRLSRKYLRDLGLRITDLEENQIVQDLVLSVHHCTMLTFEVFPLLTKLVQNHNGKFVVRFDKELLAEHSLNRHLVARKTFPSDPDEDEDEGEAAAPPNSNISGSGEDEQGLDQASDISA